MDGRDCGPPRSVHLPPPLLTGLAMESHRLGAAAAAGRIPPSPGHLGAGHSASLHTGKYLSSAINLRSHHGDAFPVGSSPFLGGYVSSSNPHGGPAPMTSDPSFRAPNPTNLQMAQLWASHLHEGFSHLSGSLYPGSYIPLGPLEHPSSGSPLHAQLGQHPLFEPPKVEGFYLPVMEDHPPCTPSPASPGPTLLAPCPGKGRSCTTTGRKGRVPGQGEALQGRAGEPHPAARGTGRTQEEPRSHSVVDLTEDDRRTGVPHRPSKKASPFFREPLARAGRGAQAGRPLQTSSLSNCRVAPCPSSGPPGPDQDRWHRDLNHGSENTRPGVPVPWGQGEKCDPAATSSIGTLHASRGSPSPHGNPAHLPNRLMSTGTYPPPPLPPHLPPSLYPLYPIVKDPGGSTG
ncbi:hypothetical protein ANANG_G00284680 [Anguilla anguilla]|uniref:BAH domain-containing protein n=1 Tax=Anguilla anguilla TaxID=7936 RepID=A0A9D3LK54_ANGAN|nr:hypothetical protein ANANG_G00284680 [Anguilla anguilla]